MDFDEADSWSKEISIRYLTRWYDKQYVEYRRCNADDIRDKNNGYYWLQRLGVDVIGETSLCTFQNSHSPSGNFISIDEKIVQPRRDGKIHSCFYIETMSCSVAGHESQGWIYTSKAEKLLYCMLDKENELHCYLFNISELQKWFMENYEKYKEHTNESENRTKGRLVPKSDVKHLYEYFTATTTYLMPKNGVDLTAPVVINDDDSI